MTDSTPALVAELQLTQQALGDTMRILGKLCETWSAEAAAVGEVCGPGDDYQTGLVIGRVRAVGRCADAIAHLIVRLQWQASEGADNNKTPAQRTIDSSGVALVMPRGLPMTPAAMVAYLEAVEDPSDAEQKLCIDLLPLADKAELAKWRERMAHV